MTQRQLFQDQSGLNELYLYPLHRPEPPTPGIDEMNMVQ